MRSGTLLCVLCVYTAKQVEMGQLNSSSDAKLDNDEAADSQWPAQ